MLNIPFPPRLNLGSRLTLSIGLVIGVTSLALFFGIYRLQEQQAESHLDTQSRALLTEMVGLRQWIATYGGIWTNRPGDYYLDSQDGFYRKSPAMVTKELSNLLNATSDFRFHITSLRPINPANAPDEFENQALHGFETNGAPVARIETMGSSRVYRLMIPLKTEASCLECHGSQGYKVGDIRGGLSVLVPMATVDQSLQESRSALILSAAFITALVMIVLYILVRRLIIRPVTELKGVAVSVGQGDYTAHCSLRTGDELQMLGETLNQMVASLKTSLDKLQDRVEQRTRELNALSDVALTISRAGALDDVLNEALEIVVGVTEVDGGVIHLVEGKRIRLAVARGLTDTLLPLLEANPSCHRFIRQILDEGQAIHAQNVGDRAWQKECFGSNCSAVIAVPLRSRNRTLGTLTLYSASAAGFAPESVQLLICIGNQLGVAVEKAYFAEQAEQVAVLEERGRIARELHDSLAQALGYLNLRAELLEGMLEHEEWSNAQAEMANVRRVVRDACYDVRESIDGLRTRFEGGLLPTAATFLQEFGQRAGLSTEFVTRGEIRLSPLAEPEVLRIIQEALTNVRKHAKAQHVRVLLEADDDHARIVIEDNGCGFDAKTLDASQHFGLRIMRERAEKLGGRLDVTSAPDQGTRVRVQLKMAK